MTGKLGKTKELEETVAKIRKLQEGTSGYFFAEPKRFGLGATVSVEPFEIDIAVWVAPGMPGRTWHAYVHSIFWWKPRFPAGATFKIISSSVFLWISRHACQSSGCDCTLPCCYYLQPEYKNKYGYPGPLPNHHSFSVLILKLLKPSAFLFSEFSFFSKSCL